MEFYNQSFHLDSLHERRSNRYALVIFLPEELDAAIRPLRERFDPDYNQVPAHITILFPFDWNGPVDNLTAGIQLELANHEPFSIELGSVKDFYPTSPVMYWNVERGREKLKLFYHQLCGRLDLALPHTNYIPHVTMAQEISDHRLMLVKEEIDAYLRRESFEAVGIDLITPLAGLKWVSVRTFSL